MQANIDACLIRAKYGLSTPLQNKPQNRKFMFLSSSWTVDKAQLAELSRTLSSFLQQNRKEKKKENEESEFGGN